MVQDWITLELAVRIHYSKGYSNISESAKKNLRCASHLLFSFFTLAFIVFCIIAIVSANFDANAGHDAFGVKDCLIVDIIGYLYLI